MAGKIKGADGTWHNTPAVYVKGDDNAWHLAVSAFIKTATSTWSQWFLRTISDTFTRTTSGSLGTSDSGNVWTNIKGTWYANGSAAQSNYAATNYSIATTVDPMANQPFAVSANTTNGCGVSYWVTDAGSWFATIPIAYSASESYSYSYCIADSCCTGSPAVASTCSYDVCCGISSSCVSSSCCTGSPGTSNTCKSSTCCTGGYYNGSTFYPCVSNSCCTGSPATASTCQANSCCSLTYSCVPNSCCTGSPGTSNTCAYSSCCSTDTTTGTRTRYYWVLRVLKSISGTITTVGDTALSNSLTNTNPVAGVSVSVSGSSYTSTAYSDSALTTSLGSVVYTDATTHGANFGIIKAPSTDSQGSTVDNFTAKFL